MDLMHLVSLAVGFALGLVVGRKNPTLAAAAAKYVASVKSDFDAAVAKVTAKKG